MASLRLGDATPDFTQRASAGDIHFHQWLGDSRGVLFSHPADALPSPDAAAEQVGRLGRISTFTGRRVPGFDLASPRL